MHSVDDCGPQDVIDEVEFVRGCEAIVVEYLKRQLNDRKTIGQAPGPGGANVGQALGHGGAQDYISRNQGGDDDDHDECDKEEVRVTNPGGDGEAVGKPEHAERGTQPHTDQGA